jgi:hypothetical protein
MSSEQDRTSGKFNGHMIDYRRWDEHMEGMICRCAKRSFGSKFKIFGMQSYGKINKFPLVFRSVDSYLPRFTSSHGQNFVDSRGAAETRNYCALVIVLRTFIKLVGFQI